MPLRLFRCYRADVSNGGSDWITSKSRALGMRMAATLGCI